MKKKPVPRKNFHWYLVQMRDDYSSSGYTIAQYVDGVWIEQGSESALLDLEIYEVIKELKEK